MEGVIWGGDVDEGAVESGADTSPARPAAVSAAVSRRETTGWDPRVSDRGEEQASAGLRRLAGAGGLRCGPGR